MAAPTHEVPTDLSRLPAAGTAERREWDRTLRQANELYPDWSSIRIGNTRFARDAYEKHAKGYFTAAGRRRRSRRPEPPPANPGGYRKRVVCEPLGRAYHPRGVTTAGTSVTLGLLRSDRAPSRGYRHGRLA